MSAKQQLESLFNKAVIAGFWICKDHGKWYVGKKGVLKQYGPFNKTQAKQQVCALFTAEENKQDV